MIASGKNADKDLPFDLEVMTTWMKAIEQGRTLKNVEKFRPVLYC